MRNKFKNRQAGYSLIEIAIVLVILGLLISGVVKGKELIESAKLKALVQQVFSFRTAHTTFLERFNALPGDFNQASVFIDAGLSDGNSDYIISGNGLDPSSESCNYWLHLAAADLITKPGKISPQSEVCAPVTKLGGVISVEHDPAGLAGHWYVIGSIRGNRGDGGLLTPKQAAFIDRNFDNGDPNSGDFRVNTSGNCVTAEGKYNLQEQGRVCVGYFKF